MRPVISLGSLAVSVILGIGSVCRLQDSLPAPATLGATLASLLTTVAAEAATSGLRGVQGVVSGPRATTAERASASEQTTSAVPSHPDAPASKSCSRRPEKPRADEPALEKSSTSGQAVWARLVWPGQSGERVEAATTDDDSRLPALLTPAFAQALEARARGDQPSTFFLAAPPERWTAREGRVWTQAQNGVMTVPATGRVQIKTRGAIVVTGDSGSGVRYALVKRVKSRAQADAQRLFAQYKVLTAHNGDISVLEIVHAGEEGQSAELTVHVPATLRELSIETHGGPITASGVDGAVKAETGGGPVTIDDIGGIVTALTAGGEISLGNLRGALRCKSAGGSIEGDSVGGDADLETAGGDIVVSEVRGSVRATTAGGGIHIGRAGATVTASTAGGTIDIGSARGAVRAKNNGGPIQIGGADNVRCETAGGLIRLNKVSGSVNAWTGVGNIIATLVEGGRITESSLSTGGGDITVSIPANFAVTIRAENGSSGSIKTIVSDDFPGISVRTVGRVAVAEGKVHGGGPLLKLSATGGTIFIKKMDP